MRTATLATSCSYAAGSRAQPAKGRALRCAAPRPAGLRVHTVAHAAAVEPVSFPAVLEDLIQGKDLSQETTAQCLNLILDGADPAQISAFLVLLAAKGETAAEVAGMAQAMRSRAMSVPCKSKVVDIVGTGGDGIGSINISTGSSIIVAAAGGKVAKHGSRSVSSLCGSADVLEALDIAIDLGPEGVAACIDEAGVGFMFAQRYHPAMKAVKEVRGALKVRTAFNILGPMLNPAGADYGLVGVYSPKIAPLMAEALQKVGMTKALVVHSCGLDELTPMGPADVVEVTSAGTKAYTLDPKDVGIPRCEVEDLAGGAPPLNAQILKDIFGGAKGACADALCLNAGYALAAMEVASSPQEGIKMAQEAQQSGKAADVLSKWQEVSHRERMKEEAHEKEEASANYMN